MEFTKSLRDGLAFRSFAAVHAVNAELNADNIDLQGAIVRNGLVYMIRVEDLMIEPDDDSDDSAWLGYIKRI